MSVLKQLRQTRELTPEQAAADLGVDWSTYMNWEAELRQIPEEKVPTLCRVFGVEAAAFDGLVKTTPPPAPLVRPETLRPYAQGWQQPLGEEVRLLLGHCELTGREAADLLGVKDARTIRKWTAYDPTTLLEQKLAGTVPTMAPIPFAAWAILVECAGQGKIWALPED